MAIESFDIAPIPLYDEDVRAQGYPAPVQDFRVRIAASDAVLLVTPEYNYSIPGVLKNALDWASRPPQQPFSGKPVAIMGASPGRFGTARGQYHLRQVLVAVNALALNFPEVMVSGAAQSFDASGRLTDPAAREQIGKQLVAFSAFVRGLKTA